MRRVRLAISGRVQGVSYRASAAHEARTLGLTGWVVNRPDGGVALEAQGPPDRLDLLIAWCRHGPRLARVDRVDVVDLPTVPDERGFAVER